MVPSVRLMTSKSYFDTRETAQRYGLSTSFLNKLRVYGGGPTFIKVGRRVLYDQVTFEEWLENHRRTSTSEGR